MPVCKDLSHPAQLGEVLKEEAFCLFAMVVGCGTFVPPDECLASCKFVVL